MKVTYFHPFLARIATASLILSATAVHAQTRTAWAWPFAQNSIWNQPIGSGAVYVNCNMGVMGLCNADNDLIYQGIASDPSVQDYRTDGQFGTDGHGATGKFINIPSNFIYPAGPNNASAFLGLDGRTIMEFGPYARPSYGSTTTGYDFGNVDLFGPGITGAHAGSSMSSIGGSIRPGELTGSGPITHAMKIELDWVKLSPNWPGKYRWPAQNSDGYGNNTYSGTVTALTMGSLCALPSSVNVSALTWKSPFGQKIAQAFQDYGAYVVDTTANNWNVGTSSNPAYTMALCFQNEAITEVNQVYGINFRSGWGGGGANWTSDMAQIYSLLAVVDNNSATNIGGGGTPRRPLAPAFKGHYEGESLTVLAKSSATVENITDAGYSNGASAILRANGVGDFVTLNVPSVSAGSYNVRIGCKVVNTRGQFQLAAAPAGGSTFSNIGSVQDEYSSDTNGVITAINLGTWTPATTSDKQFRFTVTGKNAASTGYSVTIDYIQLTPLGKQSEAESIASTSSPSGLISLQSDPAASAGAWDLVNSTAVGQSATFTTGSEIVSGTVYDITVGIKAGPNRGIFQLSVNGFQHGDPVDEYESTGQYTSVNVGPFTPGSSGAHTFTFTVTGKNAASSSYQLGIDYIILTPR